MSPLGNQENQVPLFPEEEQVLAGLENFKQAAERGIVVQRKTEDASDLDGNMSVHLLRQAGIITDSTPVFYVDHEQLDGFLSKRPEIGMMIDISPEEVRKTYEQHRQADGSVVTTTPQGEQIHIFDHHDPTATQSTASSTRQVYERLIRLGAIREPATDTLERTRIDNLLDFVDAQDNKNYYQVNFDVMKTAHSAFGLMNIKRYPRGGQSYFLHQINPATKKLDSDFIHLMELTGKDPARVLSDAELQSTGILPTDIRSIERRIRTAVGTVDKLREQGMIVKTRYGSEIVVDVDKAAVNRLKGVDWTDVLYAAGVKTRASYFRQPNGEYMLFVASNDPKIKATQLADRFGGTAVRNMYLWQPWREGQSAPRPGLLADELDIAPEEGEKISRLETEYPRAAHGETYRQKNEKSCAIACLVNLASYLFGEKDAQEIERWLIERAKADGLFNPEKGMGITALIRLAKKLEYSAAQYTDLTNIERELKDGKGVIAFSAKHAVAMYLSKNPITGKEELVCRDPIARPTQKQPGLMVMDYTTENLEKLIGPNSKAKANPYGHVLVVGKRGSKPGATGAVDIRLEQEAREITERELAENPTLTFEDRLARIMNAHRSRLEIAGAPDFDKSRRGDKDPTISSMYNPFLWPRALARMLTNKSFWVADKDWRGRTDWQKTDAEVTGFVQSLADSRLEQAYYHQIEWLKDRVEGGTEAGKESTEELPKNMRTPDTEFRITHEHQFANEQEALAWYESRLISEAIVFAEQDNLVRKNDAEYTTQLQANIDILTKQKEQYTYTKREQKSLEARIKYLQELHDTVTGKPLAQAKVPVSELRARFYALQNDALTKDVGMEKQLMAQRHLEITGWIGQLKKDVDILSGNPLIMQAIREMRDKLDQYRQLGNQFVTAGSAADIAKIREFIELQDEQSRQYHQMIWQLACSQTLLGERAQEQCQTILATSPFVGRIVFDPKKADHLEWLGQAYEQMAPTSRITFRLLINGDSRFKKLTAGRYTIKSGESLREYAIRRLSKIS